MKSDHTIVILGAGLSGLTIASYLKRGNFEIYEKDSSAGGLCKTIDKRGFTFDLSGHWLSCRCKTTIDMLKDTLEDNLQVVKRKGWIFLNGAYIRQPFQNHICDLPVEISYHCLLDFIKARLENRYLHFDNLDSYFRKNFGNAMSKYFFIPYNKKMWKGYYANFIAEGISKYVGQLKTEDIIRGALNYEGQCIGYNNEFYYPKKGGVEEIVKALVSKISKKGQGIKLNHCAVAIDFRKKSVIFGNGKEAKYDTLISSIPLPFLLKILRNAPQSLIRKSGRLKYTSLFVYNIGIDKRVCFDKHWIFFPEKEYVFHKIGFPSNVSSHLSPKETSSVYIYVSLDKPRRLVNAPELTARIKKDLYKLGILDKKTGILLELHRMIEPAYVIYDQFYVNEIKRIKQYLLSKGIILTGRFGAWHYSNLETDIFDAISIARRLNGNG